jgi:hypothetical protein
MPKHRLQHVTLFVLTSAEFGLFAMSAPAPSSDQNPPEIQFHCAVFDTAFHPLADIMAVGLVSGKIEL